MHLAYEMLNDYGRVIIVDAAPRGERPGTVTILEPARDGLVPGPPDAHGMSPEAVLGLVDALGGTSAEVLVVACEPATTEEGMDLSAPVREAVDVAADAVRQLVNGGS
jgi:hydrogenase maturation protease